MTLGSRATYRHILHPTDLSPEGDVAFQHALGLALQNRAAMSIVHTGRREAVGREWAAFPRVRETLSRWGKLPEDAAERDVSGLGLEIHKLDLSAREPGQGVANYALQKDCDLVVLATHVRHGVAGWARPSVAEPMARELAQQTATPTLFLPEGAAGFIEPRTGKVHLRSILLPIDMSPDPARAVDAALGLARAMDTTGVEIHFLHVGAGHPPIPFEKLTGLKVECHVEEGHIAEAVSRVAQNVDADLIVMATHGHDGFLDVLRGSTTEQVLHRARRALLAVPAG